MDINLALSAQTLSLSPDIAQSGRLHGLVVLKSVRTKRYLSVTPEQLTILQLFETPQPVPSALAMAIRERLCLPLAEFYELVLKALRANILVEAGSSPPPVKAHEWPWTARSRMLRRPLALAFLVGLGLSLWFRPGRPDSPYDWVAGPLLLVAALSFANFLRACLVRGAGGEVYRPRWSWAALPPHFVVDTPDSAMLPVADQRVIAVAGPAVLAAAAAAAAWYRPGVMLFPLAGLVAAMRPAFGGRFAGLIRVGKRRSLSDSEHSFLFPPNRRGPAWLRMIGRGLAQPTVWVRVAYGTAWAVAALYWVSRPGDLPPWAPEFWKRNGLYIAAATAGPLGVASLAYLAWEIVRFTAPRARSRRDRIRLWYRRWFAGARVPLDEASRVRLLSSSPVFGALEAEERQQLAQIMSARRHRVWASLPDYGNSPTHVALIVSGRVSVRREMPSGRTVHVQVLSEGDIMGLHDLSDPKFPEYRFRASTPLTVLYIQRDVVLGHIQRKVPPATLADVVLKTPFLRRIGLCRNWHRQAIDRFARLTQIATYEKGANILREGQTVEMFFIIFQGDAKVSRRSKIVGTIRSGEFFGEIGLMQNSGPNASVTAHNNTRCLGIPRTELLRFVTHNYTVALELERVSSERLGRPIFPLRKGDFRAI